MTSITMEYRCLISGQVMLIMIIDESIGSIEDLITLAGISPVWPVTSPVFDPIDDDADDLTNEWARTDELEVEPPSCEDTRFRRRRVRSRRNRRHRNRQQKRWWFDSERN